MPKSRAQWLEELLAAARQDTQSMLYPLIVEMDRDLTAQAVAKAEADAAHELEKSREQKTLLAKIMAWAEDNPKFDTSYVEKIKAYSDKGFLLSEGQEIAIDNIVEKWRMELDDY